MTREELIEAMAKRLFFEMHNIMHDHASHWAKADKAFWRSIAADGWAQAEAKLPGLSDLIDGTAVVVPKEAADAYAEGRRAGLEEAAKVADDRTVYPCTSYPSDEARSIAAAIRAKVDE